MYDVAVIGGGLTGLAAAVGAARGGLRVVVLEAGRALGGHGRSERAEGFTLNFGAHALYPSAEKRLAALGVKVRGGVPREGLTMELGGEIHPLPTSAGSILVSPGLGASGKWQLTRALVGLSIGDPAKLDDTTVAGWLERVTDPRARAVLEATVRVSTYVNAPDRLPAGVAARQLRLATRGVRYLDGGWQTIVDGLVAQAEALGVELRLEARAEAIEDGAVRTSSGERVRCDQIIVALSPKATVALLGDAAPSALRRVAEQATPVRAACLDVALGRLPRDWPSLILGAERPTYLSVHSQHARLAPEGGGVIHVMRYLAPDQRVDAASLRAELEAILDGAQPGWREVCVRARWSPAFTVMHALPDVATGGTAARPAVDATGLARVRMAGDWVGGDALLLDACLVSADAAVRSLAPASKRAA